MFWPLAGRVLFRPANRAALVAAGDLALRRLSQDLQAAPQQRVGSTPRHLHQFYPHQSPLVATGPKERRRRRSSPLDFGHRRHGGEFRRPGADGGRRPATSWRSSSASAARFRRLRWPQPTAGPSAAGTGLAVLAAAAPSSLFASPASRFQVVGPSVTYQMHPGRGKSAATPLRFLAAQTTNTAAGAANLGAGTRPGWSTTWPTVPTSLPTPRHLPAQRWPGFHRFDLAANGETVQLMDQVEVLNTP